MKTRKILTALALLLAAAGASPGGARANVVELAAGLACDKRCVDTYEVRCTQASRYICLTIESHPPANDIYAPDLYISSVATVPTSMLGQGIVEIANKFDGYEQTSCYARPGGDGGMRVQVSVFSRYTGVPSDRTYVLRAECSKGDLLSPEGLTSTKTSLQRKQNE